MSTLKLNLGKIPQKEFENSWILNGGCLFIHNKYGFISGESLGKKRETIDQIFRSFILHFLSELEHKALKKGN